MKRSHRVIVRARSGLAGRTGALIIGSAVVWMASAPRPVWSQSAWPSYPNNSAISVTSGGNVGIGKTNPASKLDVSVGNVDGIQVSSSQSGYLRLYDTTYGISWGIANDYTGYAVLNFLVGTGGAAPTTPVMTMLMSGNVGIGTTNPQSKLAVNGNITAKDVMVTNTGWSDYVFQPGYRLRPLREIGAYIQANHHLPDIPSEAEVKEKGVSVGEMQAKLLAKVEELTLHMIQADERNNRLERQNQELRDRMARLEKSAAANAMPTAAK
jgi:hypothetical protein